jgi:hypothetical protein
MNPILVAKIRSQNYGDDKENNDEETFHEKTKVKGVKGKG